jgi:hypothetical protein
MAEPVVLINAFEVPARGAGWAAAEDFTAAIQSAGFRAAAVGLAGYPPHPSLYRVDRT